MFIPDEKINEIRNSAEILEVVSESVQLKKTGQNFMGLCPFHSEKTPSFSVNPGRNIFYCFGCGVGGDVFSFVMKRDGISFMEAVKMLAHRYGVDLPVRKMSPAEQRATSERENLFKINRLAMDYFHNILMKSEQGEIARRYLTSRGMTEKIVSEFMLGYVPEGWDTLSKYLKNCRVPQYLAEKSGLIVSKNKERYYDRFRNRVIFPILDNSRQVAGFGGRVLDNSLPKYLNSPETPVYNKSRILYGYSTTKHKCRESSVVHIVEGYFDLLALYNSGVENVVATLGTAITRDHVRMLSRGGVKKFVLVFDSDAAGIKAAERSIPIFQKEFVNANILVLPNGYDPDTYIREFGKDKFLDASGNSSGVIRFLMESAVKKYGLSIEGRLSIINDMKEPLAMVDDPVARSLYIRELSGRTGVEEVAVLDKVREHGAGKSIREKKRNINPLRQPVRGQQQVGGNINKNSRWAGMERQIVTMMLQFPEIIPVCKEKNVIDFFEDIRLKSIGHLVTSYSGDYNNMVSDLVVKSGSDDEKRQITSLAIGDIPWKYDNCVKLVNQFVENRQRFNDSLSDRIRQAEENNDQELLIELINQKKIYTKSLREKQVQARKRY